MSWREESPVSVIAPSTTSSKVVREGGALYLALITWYRYRVPSLGHPRFKEMIGFIKKIYYMV